MAIQGFDDTELRLLLDAMKAGQGDQASFQAALDGFTGATRA